MKIEADLKVPVVKDIDEEQLKKGIVVEKEHTQDEEVAKTIALAHLKENPRYYDFLDEGGFLKAASFSRMKIFRKQGHEVNTITI